MTPDEMCKGCINHSKCTDFTKAVNYAYFVESLGKGCEEYQHGSLYAPAPGSGAELIEMLTTIRDCIDDAASAETINTTVLHSIKPDSLRWVIDKAIEYISNNDILIL